MAHVAGRQSPDRRLRTEGPRPRAQPPDSRVREEFWRRSLSAETPLPRTTDFPEQSLRFRAVVASAQKPQVVGFVGSATTERNDVIDL